MYGSCFGKWEYFHREVFQWCIKENWKSEWSGNLWEEHGRTWGHKIKNVFYKVTLVGCISRKSTSVFTVFLTVFFFFFLMWTIFKSILNLLQYCFCFMFWCFGHVGSSLTNWEWDVCIGGQSSNHWVGREVLRSAFAFISHCIWGNYETMETQKNQ